MTKAGYVIAARISPELNHEPGVAGARTATLHQRVIPVVFFQNALPALFKLFCSLKFG
jgi:hypothetical protein